MALKAEKPLGWPAKAWLTNPTPVHKVQELAGLESPPDIEWAAKTDEDLDPREKMPVLNLGWHQAMAVKGHFIGMAGQEVWFDNRKVRFWEAVEELHDSEEVEDDEEGR
ncbi:hypothetical protein BDV19DRAFT_386689 [Aspergillus venezuelensis]